MKNAINLRLVWWFVMASDGQYSKSVIACDPKIRGLAICHLDGMCSTCDYAKKYEDEHLEERGL